MSIQSLPDGSTVWQDWFKKKNKTYCMQNSWFNMKLWTYVVTFLVHFFNIYTQKPVMFSTVCDGLMVFPTPSPPQALLQYMNRK